MFSTVLGFWCVQESTKKHFRRVYLMCVFLEDLWLTLASQSPRALRHDWSENWCAKCFPRFGSIISSMNSAFKIYSYRPSLLSYEDNAELKQDSCSCHSPFTCFMWLSSWLIVLFMNRMPCIFVWKWSAGTLPPRPSCLLRSSLHVMIAGFLILLQWNDGDTTMN